jgi:hypothetical protein
MSKMLSPEKDLKPTTLKIEKLAQKDLLTNALGANV